MAGWGRRRAGLDHAIMPGPVDAPAGAILHAGEAGPFLGTENTISPHLRLGIADATLLRPQPPGFLGSQRTIAQALADVGRLLPFPLVDPGASAGIARRGQRRLGHAWRQVRRINHNKTSLQAQ